MKQEKVVKAYKTIQKYEHKELPIDISLAFFVLKKALSDQWEFQIKEEEKIFDRIPCEAKEDGSFEFSNAEDKKAFLEAFDNLSNLEVLEDFHKITIPVKGRMDLSISDIESLDAFVKFE